MEADRFSHFVGELESWCEPAAPRSRQDVPDAGLVNHSRRQALLSKVKSRLAQSCPIGAGVNGMAANEDEDEAA
jgi:hypothetical protein